MLHHCCSQHIGRSTTRQEVIARLQCKGLTPEAALGASERTCAWRCSRPDMAPTTPGPPPVPSQQASARSESSWRAACAAGGPDEVAGGCTHCTCDNRMRAVEVVGASPLHGSAAAGASTAPLLSAEKRRWAALACAASALGGCAARATSCCELLRAAALNASAGA